MHRETTDTGHRTQGDFPSTSHTAHTRLKPQTSNVKSFECYTHTHTHPHTPFVRYDTPNIIHTHQLFPIKPIIKSSSMDNGGSMHTVWVRLNAITFFALSVLLGLSIMAGVVKMGHSNHNKPSKSRYCS